MKTSELTGAALDWAVAKCEGNDGVWYASDKDPVDFTPSTNWAHGGEIIEREWLDVTPWPNESDEDRRWQCVQYDTHGYVSSFGFTPLVAAMRCYVASQLGDEIELPEELTDEDV